MAEVGLVEVVDVEHEPAVGGQVGAEVLGVQVALDPDPARALDADPALVGTGEQAAAGEVGVEQAGGAAVEGERVAGHGAELGAERRRVGLHQLAEGVGRACRRRSGRSAPTACDRPCPRRSRRLTCCAPSRRAFCRAWTWRLSCPSAARAGPPSPRRPPPRPRGACRRGERRSTVWPRGTQGLVGGDRPGVARAELVVHQLPEHAVPHGPACHVHTAGAAGQRLSGPGEHDARVVDERTPAEVLGRFSAAARELVHLGLRGADGRPGRRLGRDQRRAPHPGRRADRLGQDAVGLPLGDRPAGRPPEPPEDPPAPLPGALRLAAQGARQRRRAQPAGRRSPASAQAGARVGEAVRPLSVGDALRRHPRLGAPGVHHPAARRPHHHARVALPPAHLPRPRAARRRRDGDRRRGARRRRHQARRAPGAVAGAARRAARAAGAADRAVGHGASGRGGRAVPGRAARARCRRRPARHGGAAAVGEEVGPVRRRPGRGHDRARAARHHRRRLPRPVRQRRRRACHPVDLAARRGARGRPRRAGGGQPSPVVAGLHQLAPAGRAADGPAERDLGGAARRGAGARRRRPAAGRREPHARRGDGAGRCRRRAPQPCWPARTTARSPRSSGR